MVTSTSVLDTIVQGADGRTAPSCHVSQAQTTCKAVQSAAEHAYSYNCKSQNGTSLSLLITWFCNKLTLLKFASWRSLVRKRIRSHRTHGQKQSYLHALRKILASLQKSTHCQTVVSSTKRILASYKNTCRLQ